MLNTHIVEKYGNTIYPTMVITGPEGKMKIQWLIRPDKSFCELCRLHGTELKNIAADNPRKVENILMGESRYYFFTEHFREGLVNYCVFVFLYSVPHKAVSILESMEFVPKIYSSCNIPSLVPMSQHSLSLAEYVRHTGKVSRLISDFMAIALGDCCCNKTEYFYPIEQIGNRMIKEYFCNENSPCRFRKVQSDSNMYVHMSLPEFKFFLMNVMLMIAKYSLRTVDVSFKNEVETLRMSFKCPFHKSFFGLENDRNSDVIFGESCEFTCSHPAFLDYELLKRLANHLGASFTLSFGGKNFGIVEIVFSKKEAVFRNVLHAATIPEAETDVQIYTVDIESLQ